MRIFGVLIIVVLLSLAVMLYLQSHDATESMAAVDRVANSLQESGIDGKTVDKDAAMRIINELELLLLNPAIIADNLNGLREIAAIGASWAKGATSPSPELHLAVSLRAAADELRGYGTDGSARSLDRARGYLEDAKRALAGEAGATGPTDGIRDRLHNLDRSIQEKYQDVDELGN